MSAFSTIRNGFSAKELAHVASFRRQVYVTPTDINKIPSKIMIYFEDTEFSIYITSDSTTCFECKKTGHIAKNCPNRSNENSLHRSIDNFEDHSNFNL